MTTLVRQLLEDMTADERKSFYTLMMMDMSDSLYLRSAGDDYYIWDEYYSLQKTLKLLFPKRKTAIGAYRRVILFDRVVLKFEDRYFGKFDKRKTANESEAERYKKYARKRGKIAEGIYLAQTQSLSKHISIQKRAIGPASRDDYNHIESTVGCDGNNIIDDVHQGNFRRVGKKLVIIDFATNY